MLIQRNDFTKLATLLAALALGGCQLVVGFDRDRIPDDGGGMDGDMQERDAGPGDGGPTDAGSMCGNSTVEGDEQCDDGANGNDEDGCTDTCEFTCVEAADCSDDMVCNGEEVCNEDHICASGTAPADGTACGEGDAMVCFEGGCITPMCGNSTVEPGEQCDDGMNGDDTDGCTDACELTCEDDNDCDALDGECTVGVCNAAVCESMPANEGDTCDDGNMCTSNSTCAAGVCEGGDSVDCSDDATMCADSVCNPASGACEPVARNEGMGCTTDDMCMEGMTCTSGVCGGGTAVDCSDMDGACVVGVCDSATGCGQMNRTDGFICDDGDMCTTGDACASGTCAGTAVDCSVTNECQAGMCDPATGSCTTVPANEGMPCDDGDPCTTDATCGSGTCGGSMPLCPADETCNAGTCECGGGPACGGATPVCDGTECVQCLDAGDCASGEQCVGGTCGACDPDGDVGCEAGEVCRPADLTCVGCVDSGDCSGATPVCDPVTSTCGCAADADCTGNAAGEQCVANACNVCDPDDHAPCAEMGSNNVCDATTLTCRACTGDPDCAGHPAGMTCDIVTGACGT